MSLSKRFMKHRNFVRNAARVLTTAAAKRTNEAAAEYNSMFQRLMSSKHHPDPGYHDAIRLIRADLWVVYAKARAEFYSRRRKYGVAPKPVHPPRLPKETRNALYEAAVASKPDWYRKKICGEVKPFTPRPVLHPVLLPETVAAGKVGEMSFKQAAGLFKHHLVIALVDDHDVVVGDAVNMVEDYANNKDLLLKILNNLIEKKELKVFFTQHLSYPLMSNTPFDVTKITDI